MRPKHDNIKVPRGKCGRINKMLDTFANKYPNPKELAKGKIGGSKCLEYLEYLWEKKELLNRILSLILDLQGVLLYPGCGSGVMRIAGLTVEKIILIDNDERALRAAKAEADKHGMNTEAKPLDAWRLSDVLPNNSINVYMDSFQTNQDSPISLDYLAEESYILFFVGLVNPEAHPRFNLEFNERIKLDEARIKSLQIVLPDKIAKRIRKLEGTEQPLPLFQRRIYKVEKNKDWFR